MRKILILSALFLLGVCSVSAQGPWEVYVSWQITTLSSCHFQDTINDRFAVSIQINDIANGNVVVAALTQIEPYNVFHTVFDVQQQVQAHCNDTTLNTPSYKVYTVVRMVNISTHYIYCSQKDPGTDATCYLFSTDGVTILPIIFY